MCVTAPIFTPEKLFGPYTNNSERWEKVEKNDASFATI